MKCPACHDELAPETQRGQTVDRCPTCDGLWLDYSELGPIVHSLPEAPSKSPSANPPAGKPLACPRCDVPLATIEYAYNSRVFVSKCGTCRGTWLRSGQLDELAAFARVKRLPIPRHRPLTNAPPLTPPDMVEPRLRDALEVGQRLLSADALDDPDAISFWTRYRTWSRSFIPPAIIAGLFALYMACSGGIFPLFVVMGRNHIHGLYGLLAIGFACICLPDLVWRQGPRGWGRPRWLPRVEDGPFFNLNDLYNLVGWAFLLGTIAFVLRLRAFGVI